MTLRGWPFDSSDVPKNWVERDLGSWDLAFGVHQQLKSELADSTIPET
jgi:hypothetical protein